MTNRQRAHINQLRARLDATYLMGRMADEAMRTARLNIDAPPTAEELELLEDIVIAAQAAIDAAEHAWKQRHKTARLIAR